MSVVSPYKGHFKNDANILDIIYGTAKLKMFAELFCAYVVGWLGLGGGGAAIAARRICRSRKARQTIKSREKDFE